MTDPIANLIAAARIVCQAIDEGGGPTQHEMQSLRSAIYRAEFSSAETAKAAAEARPEPQLLGTTTTLREPSPGWAVVAMRVGANTLWRECPIADMAKDAAECAAVMMRRHGEARPEPKPEDRNWPEDATHENGNYQNKCALCWNQFIGNKGRVVCKVCATERPIDTMTMVAAFNQGRARPEPAQCRPHCTTMATDCDYCRPEPAAKPNEFDRAMIRCRANAPTIGTEADLCDALEALAREVRR